MKKLFSLLLGLSMLFSVTACGGDNKNTTTGESTEDTTSTTESVSDATDGTEDGTLDTTDSATDSDTTESSAISSETETSHVHSYGSEVTTDATCGAAGVLTFTCSCGDSYTEEIAITGEHSWGDWSIETSAFVGKNGTEKRTCKICSAPETRETTLGALENSFWPYYGIDGMFRNGAYSPINEERIQGYTLLEYVGYGYEGEERDGMDFEISSVAAFAFLEEHFVINDTLKSSMMEDSRYNATTDKFSLTWPGSNLNREICGYIHNGDNNYTVYYAASNDGGEECTVYWKVVLEHNAPNGKPNRYISIVRVESLPADIIK